MTAQFSDPVEYRGQSYSIAGKNGTGLFDPTQYGMNPVGKGSACWHGFVCTYSVSDQRLWLVQLAICLREPAPLLFGVPPKAMEGKIKLFDAIYEGLQQLVPYTGGLLLARDFIKELYVHMGFHPAWKYREVHEVVFRDGAVVQESDRSAESAELRQEIAHRPLEPNYETTRPELQRWIEKCFSQEYKW